MYPLFWAFERSLVTEQLASKLKNSIYVALSLKSYLIPVFIPAGLALIVLGFVLVVFVGCLNYRCRRVDDTYEQIQ